jgi:hypothetical protein
MEIQEIYGEFQCLDKYKTCERTCILHEQHNLPWLIVGDFNEIIYSHDKEQWNVRPQRCM